MLELAGFPPSPVGWGKEQEEKKQGDIKDSLISEGSRGGGNVPRPSDVKALPHPLPEAEQCPEILSDDYFGSYNHAVFIAECDVAWNGTSFLSNLGQLFWLHLIPLLAHLKK